MESFEDIFSYWRQSNYPLRWDCPFVLPPWLKAWWNTFGSTSEIYLCAVRHAQDLIGLAPLRIIGQSAAFIGSTNVCDYQDFIVAPGKSDVFFSVLLDNLSQQGITRLDLKPLRPESMVLTKLTKVAKAKGCNVVCHPMDVALELDLPATWDEYMLMLKGKQRHEVRRKLRRLAEAGNIRYRVVEDVRDVRQEVEIFFELFKSSREDKEVFMTDEMALFFRSMTEAMATKKMIKFYVLDLNGKAVATALCVDYKSRTYLYNNGFDVNFNSLSVGLLCKIFSIRDSIRKGQKKYDFLKGSETYKYRLGGQEVPLHGCEIQLR
ncbi:MAG: GNAT family N-acetyltransferase [Desulfobacteraceae bacterium]|jgi:CelD/BcsL family acetyltransferase involved in cellulose biosynthesis